VFGNESTTLVSLDVEDRLFRGGVIAQNPSNSR
jgi:hypothetical protein